MKAADAAARWLKAAVDYLRGQHGGEEMWLLTGRAARRATGQRAHPSVRANTWSRSHKTVPASLHTHVAVRGDDGRLVRVPLNGAHL